MILRGRRERLRTNHPRKAQENLEQMYAIALLLDAAKLLHISARGVHATARLWKAIESSKTLQKVLGYPHEPPGIVVHRSLQALARQRILQEKDFFPRNYYRVRADQLKSFIGTKTNCTLPAKAAEEIRAAAKKIPAHN